MGEGLAPATREQGWAGVALALAAFLLVPLVPIPVGIVNPPSIIPIDQTLWLLLPLIAACFVVGWCRGGPLGLAIVWVVLASIALVRPSARGPASYDDLSRGWGLLVAGMFGVVCLLGSGRRFLSRALAAVGLSLLLALMLVGIGRLAPGRAQQLFAEQFAARNGLLAAYLERMVAARPESRELVDTQLRLAGESSVFAAQLYVAVLALQSLVACTLAWAIYHRLSRTRLGAPLGPLREFRFNDQLIWGLVAGITMVVIPGPAGLRQSGLNLLVFFCILYFWRGLGVIAWHGRRLTRPLRAAMVVAGVFAGPFTVAAALALGVNDTWFDLRRRGPVDPSANRPRST
ncbi:MAG: YybS family protein [Gemmatimonadota bacterium]|nr:YybS family protein [Gemmatimonadota bacterium]